MWYTGIRLTIKHTLQVPLELIQPQNIRKPRIVPWTKSRSRQFNY